MVFLCSGLEVIKLFSCSSQLSMNFSLLINLKMPTKFGIFKFISREIFMLQLCLTRKNLQLLVIWDLLAGQISCTAELSMKKVDNLGAWLLIAIEPFNLFHRSGFDYMCFTVVFHR